MEFLCCEEGTCLEIKCAARFLCAMAHSLPRHDDENERLALEDAAAEDVVAADVLFEMSIVIAAHLAVALAVEISLRLAALAAAG